MLIFSREENTNGQKLNFVPLVSVLWLPGKQIFLSACPVIM